MRVGGQILKTTRMNVRESFACEAYESQEDCWQRQGAPVHLSFAPGKIALDCLEG